MTIETALKAAVDRLRGNRHGRLEAEVLLADLLGKTRVYLHINIKDELPDEVVQEFKIRIEELLLDKPLQYLTGSTEWMGLEFKVDENVLIPREDTRVLLEQVLALKENKLDKLAAPVIIEIGTGSGILPTLIKKNWPEARVITTEIHAETLEIARENFRKHQVDVEAYNCDFLDEIRKRGIKADIILSNPPYISEEEYEELDEGVRKEPRRALVGGQDGLSYYRRLAKEYKDVVKKRAFILVEIGWKQAMDVRQIFEEQGLVFYGTYKDDGDRDRVIKMEHMKK